MAAMELVEGDAVDSAPPVEAPKPVATQTPAPAVKPVQKPVKQRPDPIPPQHVEPNRWTIIIDAPDDESWVEMMIAASELKISMAKNGNDLKEMFQENKVQYEKLKSLSPSAYADAIDNFSAAKRSFF